MAAIAKRDSMDAGTEALKDKLQSTQLDEATSKSQKISLTGLPPNVRNNIYKYLLDTEQVNIGKSNVSYTHSIHDGVLRFKASRPPFPVGTSLFYVNKQIGAEARHYFYSTNLFVKLSVYTADARHAKTMVEDSGLLFSIASAEKVEKCTQHAMDLTIVEKNSSQHRTSVMFPAQYLPRLINFLDQAIKSTSSWAPNHAIFANVRNTWSFSVAKLQGDLLELFRLLTNMGKVEIDSENLLPSYADGLQKSMTAATFDPNTWLSIVKELSDRADATREKRDWDLAHQHGQSAIIALTYAYLTRPETLHSQPEEFSKEVQRLRWHVELGIGKALFKQHQSTTKNTSWLIDETIPLAQRAETAKALLAAETSLSSALSLATDSPNPASNPWFQTLPPELIPPNKTAWFSDEERGLTWYACGIVHTMLGEHLFAAGDLERACGLHPKGKNFAEAFERARDGINWELKPGSGMKRAAQVVKQG